MGKTFTMGDIHGRHEALLQCLNRSGFNPQQDKLIQLGDVVDGGFATYAVIEELLKLKNLVYVIGNHDVWFMDHIKDGWADEVWIQQGGGNTLRSYGAEVIEAEFVCNASKINFGNMNIPEAHKKFFEKGLYHYEQEGMVFVHGGFNPKIPKMTSQSKHDLTWDRNLIGFAIKKPVPGYKKVFVGHTTTESFGKYPDVADVMAPIWFNNLCCMDCGAGWSGKLAIMDIHSGEYWTSDKQDPARQTVSDEAIERMFGIIKN